MTSEECSQVPKSPRLRCQGTSPAHPPCSLSARSDHLTNSAIAAASSVIVHTTWPTSAAGMPTSGPSSSPAAAEVVKTTSTTGSTASATAAVASATAAAGTSTSGAEMMRVGGMGLLVALIGGTVALGI